MIKTMNADQTPKPLTAVHSLLQVIAQASAEHQHVTVAQAEESRRQADASARRLETMMYQGGKELNDRLQIGIDSNISLHGKTNKHLSRTHSQSKLHRQRMKTETLAGMQTLFTYLNEDIKALQLLQAITQVTGVATLIKLFSDRSQRHTDRRQSVFNAKDVIESPYYKSHDITSEQMASLIDALNNLHLKIDDVHREVQTTKKSIAKIDDVHREVQMTKKSIAKIAKGKVARTSSARRTEVSKESSPVIEDE